MTLLPPIPPQPAFRIVWIRGGRLQEGARGPRQMGCRQGSSSAGGRCPGLCRDSADSHGISAGKVQSEYGTRTPSLLKDAPPLLLIATGILLGLAGVAQLVHTFRRGPDD